MTAWRLLSAAVLVASGMAQAETGETLAACYGDTLEVSLPTGVEEDSSPEATVFSVSPELNVGLPEGVLPEYTGFLDGQPCLAEPVHALRIRGGFPPYWAGEPPPDPPALQGIRLHLFILNAVDPHRALSDEARRSERVLGEGRLRADGFQYWPREGDCGPFCNIWLFPQDHPSPIGTRVWMMCDARRCDVSYRVAPTLQLDYSFLLPRRERGEIFDGPELDWLRIDRYVRDLVLGWRVGQPTAGVPWTWTRTRLPKAQP